MKFFSSASILASLASTAFAVPLDDFGLGTSSTIEHNVNSNLFIIRFFGGTASTDVQFDYKFYDFTCKATDKGDGAADGFTSAWFGKTVGAADPTMVFTVDMSTVKKSDTFTPNGANSKIRFCVRNSVSTSDGAIEVNFQESQVTLTMDLNANVITEAAVEKKAKKVDIETEHGYTITTTLCDNTSYPLKQGELVSVCMEPTSSDIVITSLNTFKWRQRVTFIEQQAIDPADTAANALSTGSDCPRVLPTLGAACKFASMLKADFFTNTHIVDGAGTVNFALNRRRLNARISKDAEARLLQGL